jgi:iron complex transport system substrate-binding protein
MSRVTQRRPPLAATLTLGLACCLAAANASAAVPAPAYPHRVVSLAPSLTEFLFALGAGDTLVGVTQYCDYPSAATALPKIGGVEDGSINLERVVSLRPQLVVAIGDGQEQAVAALRRLGLRVEVVRSQSLSDVFDAALRLGELLGRQEAARQLVAGLDRRLVRLRKAVAAIPAQQRPRVFFELWDRPLMTATHNTLVGSLIELAGGVNIFAELPGRYPQVSMEAVLQRNPEVLAAPDHHATAVDPKELLSRLELYGLPQAKVRRVLVLDGDLISRAGPRIADALEQLARMLHPHLFPLPAGGVSDSRGVR